MSTSAVLLRGQDPRERTILERTNWYVRAVSRSLSLRSSPLRRGAREKFHATTAASERITRSSYRRYAVLQQRASVTHDDRVCDTRACEAVKPAQRRAAYPLSFPPSFMSSCILVSFRVHYDKIG